MPTADALLLFALAGLALIVVPGPSVLYIVSRSLGDGRRAGLLSAAGVGAGGVVHVAAATAGVSAVLASSASAFAVVKYAGASYLVVLGVRRLLDSRGRDALAEREEPAVPGRVFWQGTLVQVLNPKIALFFVAFLPQFADPARGPLAPQLALLGAIFVGLALVSDSSYALLAGVVRRRLGSGAETRRSLGRLTGGTYIGLGAVAALTGTRPAINA
jgi:threonine/homoserine/homoserine lactone efflux protein